MKQHHRLCSADTVIVHYTWFALSRTFCGLPRLFTVPFTSHRPTCVVCIATEVLFSPGMDVDQEMDVAMRKNGFGV